MFYQSFLGRAPEPFCTMDTYRYSILNPGYPGYLTLQQYR